MLKRIVLIVFLIVSNYSVFSQKDEISLISWNIKDFGKTKNAEELNEIAEVVKGADILAIQEVVAGYGGAQAVAKLSAILNRKGDKWDYVISDPTNSPKYSTERYAFIWKTKRIKIKNRGWLVSELDPLIDREPFYIDFYIEGKRIGVLNFHSRPYDKDPKSEIWALSQFAIDSITTPLIIAGDFNVAENQPIFDILKNKGFKSAIQSKKTTLRKACERVNYLSQPIDNIFYAADLSKTKAGVIDFVRTCDNLERSRKLSDHLPVFIGFRIN